MPPYFDSRGWGSNFHGKCSTELIFKVNADESRLKTTNSQPQSSNTEITPQSKSLCGIPLIKTETSMKSNTLVKSEATPNSALIKNENIKRDEDVKIKQEYEYEMDRVPYFSYGNFPLKKI